MLAVTVIKGLVITQYDVTNAYLYSTLKHEIFMTHPPGYPGTPGTCLQLLKGLYGLKQAGKLWADLLRGVLKKFGFSPLLSDVSSYVCLSPFALIVVHVDDILLATLCAVLRKSFEEYVASHFLITREGVVKTYLNINVKFSDGNIEIYQSKYINFMLNRFGLQDCNPATIPLTPGLKFQADGELINETEFRGIIGSLLYASRCTRPDVTFATAFLSQFSVGPRRCHLTAAYRVLKYFKNKEHFSVKFHKKHSSEFFAMCDSDWGNNCNDRKSFSGFVIFLGGGPVVWSATKQRCVSLSSCEAEFVAAAECAKMLLWIRNFLREIGMCPKKAIPLYIDNEAAKLLIANATSHQRSKHIDIRYFFIRDLVTKGIIEVRSISTDENISDIFTKGLAREKFSKFSQQLLSMEK
jgi:hypothetical protein